MPLSSSGQRLYEVEKGLHIMEEFPSASCVVFALNLALCIYLFDHLKESSLIKSPAVKCRRALSVYEIFPSAVREEDKSRNIKSRQCRALRRLRSHTLKRMQATTANPGWPQRLSVASFLLTQLSSCVFLREAGLQLDLDTTIC